MAHEGHGGVAPAVHQLRVGNRQWRIAVGTVPADPVTGELVRIETQAVELPIEAGASVRPFTLDHIKFLVDDRPIELKPTDTPAVYGGMYRATARGAHRIIINVNAASSASGEFLLQVRAGPIDWLRTIVAATIAILLVIALVAGWRRRRGPGRRAGWPAFTLSGMVVALLAANRVVVPTVAAQFLPDRAPTSIDWVLDEPSVIAGSPEVIERASGDARGASAAHDITSAGVVVRVVSAPNRTFEIMVPIPGRIVPLGKGQPRVGGQVVAGQQLTALQPTYVMHDALHLINQRWPILLSAIDAKRRMLEADVVVDRMKIALDLGAVSQRDLQLAQATEAAAIQENDRWVRALAMHDAQIRDEQPSRMNIVSPIAGQIEVANFTQGQLVHEGEHLFTIVDLSEVWAEAKVPEQLVRSFQRLQSMYFVTPAFRGSMFKGTLQRVAAELDPETRTLSHFYAIANPRKLLRIGMVLSAAQDTPPSAEMPPPTTAFSVLGHVEAKPEFVAQVTAPIWGRVEFSRKRIAIGDSVRKGDSLMNLVLELSADERYQMQARSVEIASAVASAQIRKQQAELEYRQAVALMRSDPQNRLRQQQVQASEQLFRAARADQELFEGQQNAFKTVMERRDPRITPVTAPISGVVTQLDVKPGELNLTGEFRKLCTIVELSRVWIEADVFEGNLGEVLKGVRGSFTVADQDVPLPLGPPVAVLPTIDAKTRTLKVIFEAPNPDGRLRLGMTTHVWLESTTTRTN
jgi:cobalt-zinc-cadmium efflux system membrane fusion protein